MSCNYADGLSAYPNKGIVGVPEKFDREAEIETKCAKLAELINKSEHVVVHTGAGISTSAGIPDFRGPNGVWTLERRGKKPNINISFEDAVPTKTHMALKALIEAGYVQYIISQNIDGLHMKSGLPRKYVAELHGNIFIEQCGKCRRQFIRQSAAETVGQKPCGGFCRAVGANGRACRGGILLDNVLDWEHDLPERDMDMALMHSTLADLNIALGTTLQIIPSGNLPLKNKKYAGKLVICNLQPTKHDKKADLIISTYVDDILNRVCKRLDVEIPEYNPIEDPTKSSSTLNLEWTQPLKTIKLLEKVFNEKLKASSQQRKTKTLDDTLAAVTKSEESSHEELPTKKLKVEKNEKIKEEELIPV